MASYGFSTQVLYPSDWAEISAYAAAWSCLFYVQEFIFLRVCPKSYAFLTANQRRRWDGNTLGILFALITGPLGLYYYCTAEADVVGDLYGTSPRLNWLFTFATGYFLYDSAISLLYYDTAMVVHGFFCFSVYFLAQHPEPFTHHILSFTLAYELSTPFLNGRSHLLQLRLASTRTFQVVQHLFAFVFFAVRICLGLPIVGNWIIDVVQMLRRGEQHNYSIPIFFLVASAVLNGLNIFWAYKIATGLFKRRDGKKSSSSSSGSSSSSSSSSSNIQSSSRSVSAVVAAVEERTLAAVESAVIAAHQMESAVSTAAAGARAAVTT
jgi:hypothetical protein